jgi:EAL domain-containing protein (putative c-di-GMP-specific phosphodiesterase class I)
MPKTPQPPSAISPDYFDQGRDIEYKPATSAGGLLQHHEIGEAAYFLRPFGRTYREALENLITGSIQIIGLDDVKAQYAEQWGSIAKNVLKITNAFLSRKLGKSDIFVPLDDGRFALLFAGISRNEALEKSTVIASELVSKLFGELPGGDLISVEAAMLEIEDFDGLDRIKDLDDLIRCFRIAIDKTQDKQAKEFRQRKPTISVRFRPLVNRRKNFVAMNEAVVFHEVDGQSVAVMSDDPVFTGTPALRAELDFLVLRETGKTLEHLGGVGNKPTILVSVHSETLADSFWRGKYARILSALSEYTCRHLLLNVHGTVTGTPNSRYRQIFTSLRSMVLGFAFEVNPGWSEFEAIKGLPIHALSVSGHDISESSQIESLFKLARSSGRKCIWRSIESDELARAAFNMGVDYASGPIFGIVHEEPSRPFSLPT